jgi:hypothetical protein
VKPMKSTKAAFSHANPSFVNKTFSPGTSTIYTVTLFFRNFQITCRPYSVQMWFSVSPLCVTHKTGWSEDFACRQHGYLVEMSTGNTLV